MQDACLQLDTMPDCDEIAQSVASFLRVHACLVSVATEQDLLTVGSTLTGTGTDRIFPRRDPLMARALAADRVLRVADLPQNAMVRDAESAALLNINAFLGVPLHRTDGDVVGLLCAISHAPRLWRETDVQYLLTVAQLLQARIERHVLMLEQEALSAALAENDAVLIALASSEDRPRTVQNGSDDLLFVSRALAVALGLSDRDMVELPAVARALARNGGHRGQVTARLPDRGEIRLQFDIQPRADGLLVAEWGAVQPD